MKIHKDEVLKIEALRVNDDVYLRKYGGSDYNEFRNIYDGEDVIKAYIKPDHMMIYGLK